MANSSLFKKNLIILFSSSITIYKINQSVEQCSSFLPFQNLVKLKHPLKSVPIANIKLTNPNIFMTPRATVKSS